jgi:subtilase family serine protease
MKSVQQILAMGAVFGVVACSGAAHTGSAPLPQTAGPAALPSGLSSIPEYGQEQLKGATLLGAAKLPAVTLDVLVQPVDAPGLLTYAQQANSPGTGMYRRWLTPTQIAARFGATSANYTMVAKYFHSQGLAVAGFPQRLSLNVSGSQSAMEKALGAKFGSFTKNGVTFRSLITVPTGVVNLPITALVGATTFGREQSSMVKLGTAAGIAPGSISGYSASQIAAAFDYTGAYNAGYTGAGITIGIIGTGPIEATDVPTYKAQYHIVGSSTVTQVNVQDSSVDGLTPNPPLGFSAGTFANPPPTTRTTGSCQPNNADLPACNPEDVEAQLDTEQAAALARDANVNFYLGYEPSSQSEGLYGTNQTEHGELQQVIADNNVDILSLSYGIGEIQDVGQDFTLNGSGQVNAASSLGPVEFAALASEGVTVFASSGDSGALECSSSNIALVANDLCVEYPATDPNVVAVGGVNSPLAPNGQFIGPITGWGFATESGLAASGGGVSQYFPVPAYQSGIAGLSGSGRNTPDVSLDADANTGVAVVEDSAFSASTARLGGTSVSSPEMAAMWALVLQACKQTVSCSAPGGGGVSYRFGNPNPLFYAIYNNPAKYAATFYDVVFGNNSMLPACPPTCSAATPIPGYQAGTGYDQVTGIGVPFARALIRAIVGV